MGTASGSRAGVGGTPRIVVGVDGSPGSRAALRWALAEAAARGASLDVLAAYPVELYWSDPYLADLGRVDAIRADTVARARAMVDEVLAEPESAGARAVPLAILTAAGRAAEHLVHEGATADLLVVGNRGRSALRSALLGSVALHSAVHAPCAVVVVHEHGADPQGPVVVGIDDTDVAREALVRAVEEAVVVGAPLHVVAVYQPLEYWSDGYAPLEDVEPDPEQVEARARAIVGEVLGEWPEDRRPETQVTTVRGVAGDVLVEHGKAARLLVVGSRGHNQLTGLVLGSVALHCVIAAACPVMVVHPRSASTAPAGTQAQSVPAGG